ncbi:dTDP-4-dehydrorhamnose 3,5-epimerase [Daejeonella oryzae]|uniref:dTDP-4-dehydrorhamnose 3,5-epimerase n=1 Tax=Daejeonella oryzae TaxID=1122943 RepID=UPI0003FC67AC|nr:dTDP-4-dehydrorhamnose 3,5-epimerase [Daejeonella oryzae]
MKFIETELKDALIIEPKIWKDDRGYFYESFSKKLFKDAGIDVDFVQDNQSLSQPGTLRGLHAQAPPFAQGKLVRVIQGKALDVIVDARTNSATFGKHLSVELSGENHRLFWVPPGFLHGFVTLEENTIFSYKVTNLYNKESEIGVIWNDPTLNIDWQINPDQVILSEKDKTLPTFKDFESPFNL